jgi:four helix bundle protein
MPQIRKTIVSFRDLEIYQKSYQACLEIAGKILPRLPLNEKYDLTSQLSRSSKAVPRLIAEGFGKKHQKLGFHKYLDDAIAEVNETIVSLEQIRDIYKVEPDLCRELVITYDRIARQIYTLSSVWTNFKRRSVSFIPSSIT